MTTRRSKIYELIWHIWLAIGTLLALLILANMVNMPLAPIFHLNCYQQTASFLFIAVLGITHRPESMKEKPKAYLNAAIVILVLYAAVILVAYLLNH